MPNIEIHSVSPSEDALNSVLKAISYKTYSDDCVVTVIESRCYNCKKELQPFIRLYVTDSDSNVVNEIKNILLKLKIGDLEIVELEAFHPSI